MTNTAIVTGGGAGIGRAIAENLAAEGRTVVLGDLDLKAALGVQAGIQRSGGEALVQEVDVSRKDSLRGLFDAAVGRYGRVDILVNNAGICPVTPSKDISVEEWDRVMAVNLRSVFLGCQLAAEIMKEQHSGSIVNIASVAGKIGGLKASFHYSASKAGVICLTKCYAKELAPFGIRVNAVAPGPIKSGMFDSSFNSIAQEELRRAIPLGDVGSPSDVAEAVRFLVSDAARYITGEILDVNGGLLMD